MERPRLGLDPSGDEYIYIFIFLNNKRFHKKHGILRSVAVERRRVCCPVLRHIYLARKLLLNSHSFSFNADLWCFALSLSIGRD